MPSVSRHQKAFMRIVKAYQSGHRTVLHGLNAKTQAAVKEAAGSMTMDQVDDFVKPPVKKA